VIGEIIGRKNKRKKKNKTRPVGLGPQHGLPHNCTHWPVGLGHQHGHNSTLNDDKEDKVTPQLHLLIQVSKTTEVKTAAERETEG
jgi:hypothetical protein